MAPTPSFISSLPVSLHPKQSSSPSPLPSSPSLFPHAPCYHQPRRSATLMTCAPLPNRQHDDKQRSPSLPVNNESPTQLAHLELGAGNPHAAIPLLEAHLADFPQDSRAWLQLSKAIKLSTGFPNAITAIRRAISIIPNCPHLWHYYAELTSRTSGPHKARQTLKSAIEVCPKSSALFCTAAEIEAKISNYKDAIPLFESAVSVNRTDAIIYLKWADAERARHRYDRARFIFQKGLRMVSKRSLPILFTAYAGMEANGKNFDTARNLYRLAAECNPKDKLIWQPWACMEERAGDLERARELFERAVLVDPKFTSSWQSWGLLEQKAGNLDTARSLFERGTQIDPRDPICWQAWATLEADNGNLLEARRLFAEGAERSYANDSVRAATLFLTWGKIEEVSGDIELARLRFNAALERKHERLKDKIIIMHSLAGLEQRDGKFSTARKLYAKILRLNRRDYRSMYAWASMELEQSNHDEAYKLLKRCVKIAPRDPRSVETLATLEMKYYSKSGGLERARSILKYAIGHNFRNITLLKFWVSMEKEHGDPHLAEQLLSNLELGREKAINSQG